MKKYKNYEILFNEKNSNKFWWLYCMYWLYVNFLMSFFYKVYWAPRNPRYERMFLFFSEYAGCKWLVVRGLPIGHQDSYCDDWISEPYFSAVHPVVGETFQSGAKWQTDRLHHPWSHTAFVDEVIRMRWRGKAEEQGTLERAKRGSGRDKFVLTPSHFERQITLVNHFAHFPPHSLQLSAG